jgi:hypothetical protein
MDIEMETLPGISAYINKVLRDNRIRRLNIRPLLPKCRMRMPSKEEESP